MILDVTKDLIGSFAAASAHKPTQKVLDFLKEELGAMRASNDDLNGESLIRSQGACQKLREILEVFQNAPKIAASESKDSETSEKTGSFY